MYDETYPDENSPELLSTTSYDDGTTASGYDTNADGVEDAWLVTDSATGEGLAAGFDDDYDGDVDTVVTDTEVLTVDDQGNVIAREPVEPLDDTTDPEYTDPEYTDTTDYATDPADDGLIGDPYAKADYWFEQSYNGWCGPASISQFVAEYYQISDLNAVEASVVEVAMENGWLSYEEGTGFDGWSGMTTEHMALLMEELGIPAEIQTGADLGDLAQHLEEGHEILVTVDSSEVVAVDDGTGYALFPDDDDTDGGQGSDHALTVAGIDTDRGVVLLNNPGIPDGELYAVPLEDFEDAWADSGHTMIVATNPAEATATEQMPYDVVTTEDAWQNPAQDPAQSPVQSPVQTEPEFLASPFGGGSVPEEASPLAGLGAAAGDAADRTLVLLPLVLAAPIAAGATGVLAGIAARRAQG